MVEQFDFPRELRADAVMLAQSHPYTADMLNRAAVEIERLRALDAEACRDRDTWAGLANQLRERLTECEIYLGTWDEEREASYWPKYGVPKDGSYQ